MVNCWLPGHRLIRVAPFLRGFRGGLPANLLPSRRGTNLANPKPRRFDLSPDNFIAGIAGQLTASELGVYWVMCLLFYSHGGPFKYDESRICALLKGSHWRTVRTASERLQELGKITSEQGQVTVKGCSGPLQEAINRVSRAVENGSKGGRPSNKNNNIQKPNGLHSEKLARVAPSPSLPSTPPPPPEESSLRSDSAQGELIPLKPLRAKKGTRWEPTATVPCDWIQAAGHRRAVDGSMPIDLDYEARRFANYWAAKSGQNATKVDWKLTWMNWATDKEKTGDGKVNGSGKPTAHDKHLAGMASLLSRTGRAGYDRG